MEAVMTYEGQRNPFLRKEVHCKRAWAEREDITSIGGEAHREGGGVSTWGRPGVGQGEEGVGGRLWVVLRAGPPRVTPASCRRFKLAALYGRSYLSLVPFRRRWNPGTPCSSLNLSVQVTGTF